MNKTFLLLFIILYFSFYKATEVPSCNNTGFDTFLERCADSVSCSQKTCDSCYVFEPKLCFRCVDNYYLDVIYRNCTPCNLTNQTIFYEYCVQATNLTIKASFDETLGNLEINGTCKNASKLFVVVGPSELVLNQTPLSVSNKLTNQSFYFDYDSFLYLASSNQTESNSTNSKNGSYKFLVDSQYIKKSNESNYTALAFCTDNFVFNNKSVSLNISDNGGRKMKFLIKYKGKLNISQRYAQAKYFKNLLNLTRSHVVWDDNGDIINETSDTFGEAESGRRLLNFANTKTYNYEPRFLETILQNNSNKTNVTEYEYVTYFNRLYNNKVDTLYQKIFDVFLPKVSNTRGYDLFYNAIQNSNETFPPIINISVAEINNTLPTLSHTNLSELNLKTTNHSISLTFEINNTNGFIVIGLSPVILEKKVTIESLFRGKDDKGNKLEFFEQVYLEKGKPKELLVDNLDVNVYSVFVGAGSDTFRYEQKFTDFYKYYVATTWGGRVVGWVGLMILLVMGVV